MAIKIFLDNSLEALLDKLAQNIDGKYPSLAHIVVQTPGLKRWVNISLARKKGINLLTRFYGPNELINRIFEINGIKPDEQFSVKKMAWGIFDLMKKEDFRIPGMEIPKTEAKKFEFAFTLADLFDQYQIFRAPMIEKWNKGKNYFENDNDEEWQREIWLKLKKEVIQSDNDRVHIAQQLNESYDVEAIKNAFGNAIHFFGFSYLTPYHLNILTNRLKDHIDLFFYFFSPAPEVYWYDQVSERDILRHPANQKYEQGNDLLVTLGKVARDMMQMFFVDDEVLNNLENESHLRFDENKTLLGFVKKSVTENKVYDHKEAVEKDDTLQIHGHYSKLREVEGVFNFVADSLSASISPHEILVMTPDIDAYAPYIRAVFDNYELNGERIPYTIADMTYSNENTLIAAFKNILHANRYNFSAAFLFGLTDYDVISSKLDFADTAALKTILNKTGLLFFDGKEENDTRYFSWEYTARRLVYSYIMYDEHIVSPDGTDKFLLFDEVEGTPGEDVLKFVYLGNAIYRFIRETDNTRKRTAKEWGDFVIQNIVSKLFEISGSEHDYEYVLSVLEDIAKDYEEAIEFDTFLEAVDKYLYDNARGRNFITGKVTFASMVPMRSIPFKAIAMLGLNNGQFPRIDKTPSFNLINRQYRFGDRVQKYLDNYLFLETLMSAEDRLYLSYLYKDVHTDSDLAPSSCLKSLIDFILKNTNIRESELIVPHKLHLFNEPETYYKIFSPAEGGFGNDTETTAEPEQEIRVSISELLKFFTKPVEWYQSYQLRLNTDIDTDVFPQFEKIDPDGLADYWLKYYLLEYQLSGDSTNEEELLFELKMKNILPLSIKGKKIFENKRGLFGNLPAGKYLKTELFEWTENINGKTVQIYGQTEIWEFDGNEYVLVEDMRTSEKLTRLHIEAFIIHRALGKKDFACYKYYKEPERVEHCKLQIVGDCPETLRSLLEFFMSYKSNPLKVPVFDINREEDAEDRLSGYPGAEAVDYESERKIYNDLLERLEACFEKTG